MNGQGNTRSVHTAEHYLAHASTWVTMLSEESQVEKDKHCGLGAQNSRELAAGSQDGDSCHQVRNGSRNMNKFCNSI